MKDKTLYDLIKEPLLHDVKTVVLECLSLKETKVAKEAKQDEIWTAKDVANHFKMAIGTVYRYVAEKKLPSYKPNGRRIFYKNEVIEAMKTSYDLA